MGLRDELKKEELQEFRKSNGTIMRMIFMCFKRGWFRIEELYRTLESYEISKEQILEAFDYFESSGYIQTRDGITLDVKPPCEISSNMEFKLVARFGYQLGKGVITDPAIEL